MMIVKTSKISSKGQITLPSAVRAMLKSDLVRIVVEDGNIRLEAVPDVGGSLKAYAARYQPFQEAREQAWSEVVREQNPRT